VSPKDALVTVCVEVPELLTALMFAVDVPPPTPYTPVEPFGVLVIVTACPWDAVDVVEPNFVNKSVLKGA
jgi:hypothetical protein